MNRIRPAPRPFHLIAALVFAGCAGGGPTVDVDPAPAEADPVATDVASFTTEQVERGRSEFGAACGECHSTSDFRGTDFQFKWRRRTAWAFFRTLTDTMPEDAPGSLSDQQYVEVIAYILEMNGFAPGDAELTATEAALDQFVMDGAGNR